MKCILNGILLMGLIYIYLNIYTIPRIDKIYYTLRQTYYINENNQTIEIPIFSYDDCENLIFEDSIYYLNYNNKEIKIKFSYCDKTTTLNFENRDIYLYKLGIEIDLNMNGSYDEIYLKIISLNKEINFNIGKISYESYEIIKDLELTYIDENIIKINVKNLLYDDIYIDQKWINNISNNLVLHQLDTSIIQHNLVLKYDEKKYVYKFNNKIMYKEFSNYFKSLEKGVIYDRTK